MNRHTPGPWRTGGLANRFVFGGNGLPVCECNSGDEGTCRADKANACLIAAAPELLSTIEFYVQHVDGADDQTIELFGNQARTLIAKIRALK